MNRKDQKVKILGINTDGGSHFDEITNEGLVIHRILEMTDDFEIIKFVCYQIIVIFSSRIEEKTNEVLSKIRKLNFSTPVMVLSEQDDHYSFYRYSPIRILKKLQWQDPEILRKEIDWLLAEEEQHRFLNDSVTEKNVLLVDDDNYLTKMIADTIGDEFSVSIAGCVDLAVKKINLIQPDILVTDLTMPLMNGMNLVKIIRGRRPDLPIIILTGSSGKLDAIEALRLGAIDFIEKPFDTDDLRDRINAALDAKYHFTDLSLQMERKHRTVALNMVKTTYCHHLNNGLAAIKGNIDLMQKEHSSTYLENATEQLNRLISLMKEIRDLDPAIVELDPYTHGNPMIRLTGKKASE